MILILAQEYELNANRICEILDYRRVPWIRLNGEDIPLKTKLHLNLGSQGVGARLETRDGKSVSINQIRSVWARRNGDYVLPESTTQGQRAFLHKECSATLLGLYSILGHAEWMNPYFDEVQSVNKLFQLSVAQEVGLSIPETIVTQCPEAAKEFFAAHEGRVICKAIGQSGHVPEDSTRTGRVIFANRLDLDAAPDLERVQHAPTLLQAYAEKLIELRVTIVGSRIFATAIESQRSERSKDDWRRYDTKNTPYYRFDLPNEIQSRLHRMMARLNLKFGAVDLILTPKGEYVFLEVNPGGQWGWVEGMTGHPIDEAIADWLIQRSGVEVAHVF